MRKTSLRLALGLVLVLLALAGTARAGFYIGLQGGLSNETATVGDIHFDRNSSFLYGAQVGVRLLSFAVEGQIYSAGHSLASDEWPTPDQPMSYYYVGLSGKLGFPLAVLYPYLTVGYGYYSATIDEIGDGSNPSFSIGAGAELTLGKVGIFAELKYRDFSVQIEELDWDFGGLNVHFGINFHFL